MLRVYEKRLLLLTSVLVLILIEIIFFIYFTMTKIFTYEKFQGIVRKADVVSLIVKQEELSLFYRSHYIYVNNRKEEFVIQQVVRNVLKRKGDDYHEVLISFSFGKKLKENDVLEFSIKKNKIRSIEIFRIIWEGGIYESFNK